MTFLEAAIEILRWESEALHFSSIAKKAVDRKLLSHVGRDPEAAMRSCLTSAVRAGSEALVERTKPGFYVVRPGANLPEPLAPKPGTEPPEPKAPEEDAEAAKPKRRRSRVRAGASDDADKAGAEDKPKRTRTRKKTTKKVVATDSAEKTKESEAPVAAEGASATGVEPSEDAAALEFEAPTGSGLDGVTDVTIVMANAMSRLAEERPELREELEAMQNKEQAEESGPSEPIVHTKPSRVPRRDDNEERGGRRRRRRRRRARRVDWSEGGGRGSAASRADELLDKVAAVLQEAGPRSLHVRQIAETLATQNILGGEISEIERAVTSAMLLDVHNHGRGSRFSVRGDARYQLQGGRVPEGAAKAEKAFRDAGLTLKRETRSNLLGWLQSLGARALESLVRIYLQRERFTLLSTLPPGRGLGRLIAEDPEADDDERKVLVLVVPKRTSLEPKSWEGEAERNQCGTTLVFAMHGQAEATLPDTRIIAAPELADWLMRRKIAVQTIKVEVPVLDASIIESIGGLDT